MRFSSALALRYRKNGYMSVVHDPKTGYYDVYIDYPTRREWIHAVRSRAEAKKIAKETAMKMQVGFDEKKDVIY
jgi:hypothetical protein